MRIKIFIGIFSGFTLFLLYCFLPLLQYKDPGLDGAGRILLMDRNGEIITDKAYPNGYQKDMVIDLQSEFVQALLHIEDKHYYTHWGVNIPAKLRALRDNIEGKKLSGGSTIPEQYIKNTYFPKTPRSYLQKAREAVLALYVTLPHGGRCRVSDRGSCACESILKCQKDTILEEYLSTVYFGNQLYGIGAAMEVYFGKSDISTLTQEEQVLLLTLLHNPGVQSLEESYFQNYFSSVQKRLGYDFQRSYFGKLPKKQNLDRFPHVTQRWLSGDLGYPGTRTTIDAHMQDYALLMIQETLEKLKGKNVSNAAMYVLNPKTQEVLLYLGSKDFSAMDIDGQVDVVQAHRQPGSTMKPFLYLLALQSGIHPDSLIIDLEGQYESFQAGKVYVSENYSLKEYGLVRLKKALGNSFNNASVRLARELGLQRVYDFYKEYGFDFPFAAEHYGYSLVLGNAEITLENLVKNYAKLFDQNTPEKFLLYDILSDPDNRDISFGVNSLLSTSIPQAVKTGTSSDFRDNWAVSYHPDFVFGVWVGNNDNSSMQGVTGITGAGYMWHQVIEKAIKLGYIQNRNIPIPEDISQISYCLDTPCIRRENVFALDGVEYYSRIGEDIYSSRDIYESLSPQEQERLKELGIFIEKE